MIQIRRDKTIPFVEELMRSSIANINTPQLKTSVRVLLPDGTEHECSVLPPEPGLEKVLITLDGGDYIMRLPRYDHIMNRFMKRE